MADTQDYVGGVLSGIVIACLVVAIVSAGKAFGWRDTCREARLALPAESYALLQAKKVCR